MSGSYTVTVQDGYLIPDLQAIRAVLSALREDLKSNSDLKSRFNQDPRGVLGARGLSIDIQNEILSEAGEAVAEDCTATCASTDSCCCETV